MDVQLEQTCWKCGGKGEILNPKVIAQMIFDGEIQKDCEKVKKRGLVEERIKCVICEGTGVLPSEFGRRILSFIKKYGLK